MLSPGHMYMYETSKEDYWNGRQDPRCGGIGSISQRLTSCARGNFNGPDQFTIAGGADCEWRSSSLAQPGHPASNEHAKDRGDRHVRMQIASDVACQRHRILSQCA